MDSSAENVSDETIVKLNESIDNNGSNGQGVDETCSKSEFKFSENPSLVKMSEEALKFSVDRNWGQYHTPRNILLALVGEVGELSEIFQWKGEVPDGLDPSWSDKEREHLEQEISDVFIYLIRLSQVCKVDLPKAVEAKMELNKLKYPVNKCFGLNKKYDELN